MLPGKVFGPADVFRILRKRGWMIAVPLVLGGVAAYAWAKRLPDEYRAETVIMVVPQRVPESYVRTTVTGRVEDRLSTLSDQILSRSRLERIIVDLELYQQQRAVGIMEDVVERMRRDIDIRVEQRESFRVSYVSRSAVEAQKVAERLASLFIEENLRDRENLAEDTNQFLESQLEDAKRRLVEHEKKLEEYRRRYSGQLPSQAAANLQMIQSAEAQLRTLSDAIDRDGERRLLLERQLADLQLPEPQLVMPLAPETKLIETTAQQLEAARAELRALEARNTADHPDVRSTKRRILDLEAKLAAEAAAPPPANERMLSPAEVLRQRRLRETCAQIEDLDRQVSDKRAQQATIQATIADYQQRLNAVPTRESELVALTRDYDTLQKTYESLLAKREESKIAANLERRNIGEQFRVLDPARVPQRPFRPNRLRINLFGAGAGLLLGLALVALLEYRDSSFKTEEEVVRLLSMPVLAVVPTLKQVPDRSRRRRVRASLLGGAALLALAAAVAWWTLWSGVRPV